MVNVCKTKKRCASQCCKPCEHDALDCHDCCACVPRYLIVEFTPETLANEVSTRITHLGNGLYSSTTIQGLTITAFLDEESCQWVVDISETGTGTGAEKSFEIGVSQGPCAEVPETGTGTGTDIGIGCEDFLIQFATTIGGQFGTLRIYPRDRTAIGLIEDVNGCLEDACNDCECVPGDICVVLTYWPDGLLPITNDSRSIWVRVPWDDSLCGWYAEVDEITLNTDLCFPELDLLFYIDRVSDANQSCDIFIDSEALDFDKEIHSTGSFNCDLTTGMGWNATGLGFVGTGTGAAVQISVQGSDHRLVPCAECCNVELPDTLYGSARLMYNPIDLDCAVDDYGERGTWFDFTLNKIGCFKTALGLVSDFNRFEGEFTIDCESGGVGGDPVEVDLIFACGCLPIEGTNLGCKCNCIPENHDPTSTTGCHAIEEINFATNVGACADGNYTTSAASICGRYEDIEGVDQGLIDSGCGPIYAEFNVFDPGGSACETLHIIIYEQ